MADKAQSGTLDPTELYPEWFRLIAEPQQPFDDLSGLTLPEQSQKYWEDLFNKMNFPGMDLMALPRVRKVSFAPAEAYQKLRGVIPAFLAYLIKERLNDVRACGVSEEGLFYMRKGMPPENFVVHLKYPIEYGGSFDFQNLVLIQGKPFHELIHTYINKQVLGATGILAPNVLYVPCPVGNVYIPFGLVSGSGGKNKQDKSVMMGFDAETLKEIAQRSMPGR